MTRLALALLFVTVGGCADAELDSAPRFKAEPEGFSCILPDDWQLTRDRGAVILTSTENRRHTLVVRSVPLSASRDSANILADTEIVLQGLPGVELEGTRELTGALPSTEYRLTFVPPTSSERFRRRHVVLRGTSRVFHVIETAPSTVETEDVVTPFVSTMREEV
ncbi:MAG: hypothetical protein K8M05_08975 [Deltaproteobacteria bacterium]|nr:hypothetical protein [Kofleriaceae bacterium]